MRLAIFRTPNLAAANVAQLLLGAAWIPMWFFLNLYLQQVLGLRRVRQRRRAAADDRADHGRDDRPRPAADRPRSAPRRCRRRPRRPRRRPGLAVLRPPDGTFWVDVLPASLVAAPGMSLAFIPSLGTAILQRPPEEGGLAAGIVNTSYQVGSAARARGDDRRRRRARRRPAQQPDRASPTATPQRSSAPPPSPPPARSSSRSPCACGPPAPAASSSGPPGKPGDLAGATGGSAAALST